MKDCSFRQKKGGISVSCLIGHGSSISTIHPALYNRMSEKQLLSSSDVRLRMADGGLVPVCGEASFSVHTQDATYEQTMVVAEIETPVVLGYDFMCKHHCQIDVPKGEVLLKGNLVKCIYENIHYLTLTRQEQQHIILKAMVSPNGSTVRSSIIVEVCFRRSGWLGSKIAISNACIQIHRVRKYRLFAEPHDARPCDRTSSWPFIMVHHLKIDKTCVNTWRIWNRTSAQEKMLKASDRQKRSYDHRTNQHSYNTGCYSKVTVWLGGSLPRCLQNSKRSSIYHLGCSSQSQRNTYTHHSGHQFIN